MDNVLQVKDAVRENRCAFGNLKKKLQIKFALEKDDF